MSFSDWRLKDDRIFSTRENIKTLVHHHPAHAEYWPQHLEKDHICRYDQDKENWFCPDCGRTAPMEMQFVAELANCWYYGKDQKF